MCCAVACKPPPHPPPLPTCCPGHWHHIAAASASRLDAKAGASGGRSSPPLVLRRDQSTPESSSSSTSSSSHCHLLHGGASDPSSCSPAGAGSDARGCSSRRPARPQQALPHNVPSRPRFATPSLPALHHCSNPHPQPPAPPPQGKAWAAVCRRLDGARSMPLSMLPPHPWRPRTARRSRHQQQRQDHETRLWRRSPPHLDPAPVQPVTCQMQSPSSRLCASERTSCLTGFAISRSLVATTGKVCAGPSCRPIDNPGCFESEANVSTTSKANVVPSAGYFSRTFDVHSRLWKLQQQHRAVLASAPQVGLTRWRVGEIASRVSIGTGRAEGASLSSQSS